jgi:predicted N-acetyltransferase YhbS
MAESTSGTAIEITVRAMQQGDVEALARAFAAQGRPEPQFVQYWLQKERDEREILIAEREGGVVGYVTIVWAPVYAPFREGQTPEIADLTVSTGAPQEAVGPALMRAAEREIAGRGYAMAGVGLRQPPEAAWEEALYRRLGYEPDGRGVTEAGRIHLHKRLPDPAAGASGKEAAPPKGGATNRGEAP